MSEEDVKDSETDSEREDDPRGIIFYVWESVSPPVSKQVLVGKWHAVIQIKETENLVCCQDCVLFSAGS